MMARWNAVSRATPVIMLQGSTPNRVTDKLKPWDGLAFDKEDEGLYILFVLWTKKSFRVML